MLALAIPDMHCDGCARAVTQAIRTLDPAAVVQADPPARAASVQTTAPVARVLAALAAAGFSATRA